MFKFAGIACRCPDVASLAAILTGASFYLTTLGSHTLINSFVSPAIFLGLSQAIYVLQANQGRSLNNAREEENSLLSNDKAALHERSKIKEKASHESTEIHDPGEVSIDNSRENIRDTHGCNTEDHKSTEVNLEVSNNRTYTRKELNDDDSIFITGNICSKGNLYSTGKTHIVYQNYSVSNNKLCQSREEDEGYVSRGDRSGSSSSNSSNSNSNRSINSNTNSSCNNKNSSNDRITNSTPDDSDNEAITCNRLGHSDKENTLFIEQESSETLTHTVNSQRLQTLSALSSLLTNIISGLMLSMAMYVRPDTSLLVIAVLLGNHDLSRTVSLLFSPSAWHLAVGGLLGLALAALNDTIFYGLPVLTPVNWAHLNVFSSTATRLFGVSGWDFYIRRVFMRDYSMCAASVLVVVAGLICVLQLVVAAMQDLTAECVFVSESYSRCNTEIKSLQRQRYSRYSLENKKMPGKNLRWDGNTCLVIQLPSVFASDSLRVHIGSVVILTVIFSCMGHKEERFLHDTVVLFLIAVSQVVMAITGCVAENCFKTRHINHNKPNQRDSKGESKDDDKQLIHQQLVIIGLFSAVFVAHQLRVLGRPVDIQRQLWQTSSAASDLDTTLCMHFLSSQRDVSGLFIDRNIKDTGGYSILHKNVPLLCLLGNDFVEFTNASLVKEKRACAIRNHVDHVEKKSSTRGEDDRNYAVRDETRNGSRVGKHASLSAVNKGKSDDDEHKIKTEPCVVGYFSINMISDLFHKDNVMALFRKIVGDPPVVRLDQQGSGDQHQFYTQIKDRQRHIHSPKANFQHPGQQLHHSDQQHPHQEQQQQHPSPHYNYAILQANKPFLSPAFRPVYQTATMWVWRRVNTPQTEAGLRAMLEHLLSQGETNTRQASKGSNSETIGADREDMVTSKHLKSNRGKPNDRFARKQNEEGGKSTQSKRNATKTSSSNENSSTNDYLTHSAIMLEYEGETLKQLGNYWAAMTRFDSIALTSRGYNLQGKVKASVLASMVFCLHRLGEQKKMQSVLQECFNSNSRDRCLDGWQPKVSKLAFELNSSSDHKSHKFIHGRL